MSSLVCRNCPHEGTEHARGGPCYVPGCGCDRFTCAPDPEFRRRCKTNVYLIRIILLSLLRDQPGVHTRRPLVASAMARWRPGPTPCPPEAVWHGVLKSLVQQGMVERVVPSAQAGDRFAPVRYRLGPRATRRTA